MANQFDKSDDYLNNKYGPPPEKEKSVWMTLQEGENIIRLVSGYGDEGVHYGGAKPQKCYGAEHCPICKQIKTVEDEEKFKPTVRFTFYVIDRADKTFKLLSVGWQIFKQLKALNEDDEWTKDENGILAHNIKITKNITGSRKQDVEYVVNGSPKVTELTAAEKAEVEKLDDPQEILDSIRKSFAKKQGINLGGEVALADEVKADEPEKEGIKFGDIPF